MQRPAPVAPPPPPVFNLLSSATSSAQFLLNQRSCGTKRNSGKMKSPQLCSKPTPREIAEEICIQFKNCLPHTHGESDLHRAAFEGDASKLYLLLKQIDLEPYKYQTINQRNRLGCTPIRLAATGGHLECLTHLLNAGASIDTIDVKCQTPLFVAVKNRRYDCAKKLLEAGACPDGDHGNSSTPLYMAFMNRDIQYVMLLLKHGAHPDKLHHSIRNNHSMFYWIPTSLDAATEYMSEVDVYQAVKALLVRGCETKNYCYYSRYFNNNEKLIHLFYNFGVRVNMVDLGWNESRELIGSGLSRYTLSPMRGTPRRLMSACRISIISCLPRPRAGLDILDRLPLPSSVIAYLKFVDE